MEGRILKNNAKNVHYINKVFMARGCHCFIPHTDMRGNYVFTLSAFTFGYRSIIAL